MSQRGDKRKSRQRYDCGVRRILPVILLAAAQALACRQAEAPPPVAAATPSPAPSTASASAPYVPGLGELMSLTQMRHAKLWLAGEAGNWKLAAYELDELREGFDDVVRYHPTHKDSPVPIDEAVQKIMTGPLAALDEAIRHADRDGFRSAYDAVTDGCNRCHQAANFGFNVVQRPEANSFSNQSFAPPR